MMHSVKSSGALPLTNVVIVDMPPKLTTGYMLMNAQFELLPDLCKRLKSSIVKCISCGKDDEDYKCTPIHAVAVSMYYLIVSILLVLYAPYILCIAIFRDVCQLIQCPIQSVSSIVMSILYVSMMFVSGIFCIAFTIFWFVFTIFAAIAAAGSAIISFIFDDVICGTVLYVVNF